MSGINIMIDKRVSKYLSIKKINIEDIKDIDSGIHFLIGIPYHWRIDLMTGIDNNWFVIKQGNKQGKHEFFYLLELDSLYFHEEKNKKFKTLDKLKEYLKEINKDKQIEVYQFSNYDDCFLFLGKSYLFVNSFLDNIDKKEKEKLYEVLSGER